MTSRWSLHDDLPRHDLRGGSQLVADAAEAVAGLVAGSGDISALAIEDVELTGEGAVVAHVGFAEPGAIAEPPMDALATLLHHLARRSMASGSLDDFVLQRALLDLAADATNPQVTPRDPQQLADAIRRCLNGGSDGVQPARRRAALAAGLIAAAIVGVLALRPWSSTESARSPATTIVTATDSPTTQTSLAGSAPGVTSGVATTAAPPGTAPTPTVEHGGATYEIGEVGDEVVVGDWWCESTPTAAVLRPSTGELYLFAQWPEPGDETEPPPPIDVGDQAVSLLVESVEGCDRLVVEHVDGSQQLVVTGDQP
jgi:hypothetical protein